jgi:hypothetical protein
MPPTQKYFFTAPGASKKKLPHFFKKNKSAGTYPSPLALSHFVGQLCSAE